MTTQDEDTLEFLTEAGFDPRRLLEERDRYQKLGGDVSALIDFRLSTTATTARFRRPPGRPIDECGEIPEPLAHEVFRVLQLVEREVPELWRHAASHHIYIDPARTTVRLHAILLGWHAQSEPDAPGAWIRRLVPKSRRLKEIRRTVTSVRECYEALRAEGLLPELGAGIPPDPDARIEWHRKNARRLRSKSPRRAVEELLRAGRIRRDPDLYVEALEIARRGRLPETFDLALSEAVSAGVRGLETEIAALKAWRAFEAGRLNGAERHSLEALDAKALVEIALEELIRVLEAHPERVEEALSVHERLLRQFPSRGRFERALRCVWKSRRFDRLAEMEAAYPEPIHDARLLVFLAAARVESGDLKNALATLDGIRRATGTLSPKEVSLAVKTASTAVEYHRPVEQIEWVLPFLECLESFAPGEALLREERATWLLAGNFDEPAKQLLHELPDTPRALGLRAQLAFRRGDDENATELGLKAIRGGYARPELVTTIAVACKNTGNCSRFEELWRLTAGPRKRYPTVRETLERIREELDC